MGPSVKSVSHVQDSIAKKKRGVKKLCLFRGGRRLMENPILDFHYVFRTFCKKFDQNRANMTVAAAQRKQCHV